MMIKSKYCKRLPISLMLPEEKTTGSAKQANIKPIGPMKVHRICLKLKMTSSIHGISNKHNNKHIEERMMQSKSTSTQK